MKKLEVGEVRHIEAGGEQFDVVVTEKEVFFPREEDGILSLDQDARAVLVDSIEMDAFALLGKEFFGVERRGDGKVIERLRVPKDRMEEVFNDTCIPFRGRWYAVVPSYVFERVFSTYNADQLPPWLSEDEVRKAHEDGSLASDGDVYVVNKDALDRDSGFGYADDAHYLERAHIVAARRRGKKCIVLREDLDDEVWIYRYKTDDLYSRLADRYGVWVPLSEYEVVEK